ncbi:hypothetical protein EYF80_046765 [Liparis tanakae]|uniref:Uncharacterized protein n=1 Tax=Liparis tanakae TaxID=230148 RepID=A0A4Z2FQ58_9TELE|nr:hypothetical protein EYF80_046765 [Liparis tanakae]
MSSRSRRLSVYFAQKPEDTLMNSQEMDGETPLEKQLDSPTAEQLNADWLSQLGIGHLFHASQFASNARPAIYRNLSRLYVDFAYRIYSHETFATLLV